MGQVHQTASRWMSTSIEKAFLKAALCFHPVSSSREYILYANGTCWWFDFGNKPTYRISVNGSLRITRRPTLWTLVEKEVVSSCQRELCSEITMAHIPANARAVSRLKFNSSIFMRPDTTHMLLVKTLTPIGRCQKMSNAEHGRTNQRGILYHHTRLCILNLSFFWDQNDRSQFCMRNSYPPVLGLSWCSTQN